MDKIINFQNQKLTLDYLTLNISNSAHRISEFADIFSRHGFNSKVFYLATNESKNIFHDENFFHTITFRIENDSWNKETLFIQFSGDNARHFYFLLTNGFFSISQLNSQNIKIGRIDINYIRPSKPKDTDVNQFLEKSLQVSNDGISQRGPDASIQTLAIGKRDNAYYIRIYKKDSSLKFELEMKKRPAQHYGTSLLKGSWQEFEEYISKIFFKHLLKSLFLETCFTDWLNHFARVQSNKPKNHLVTSYLKKYFFSQVIDPAAQTQQKIQIYRLLQFISFVRTYQGKSEILNGQNYIIVEFPLCHFIKRLDYKLNSHQRKKFLQFFNQLQSLPPFKAPLEHLSPTEQIAQIAPTDHTDFREEFTDRSFRSLLFFPVVNLIKETNTDKETNTGLWIVQIAVAEPLMKGDYPFHLPPTFFTCSNSINLEIKLSIIKTLAQDVSIEKIYYVKRFLNQFKNRRNSIQAQVKREIVEQFHNLVRYKIIQSRFLLQGKDDQLIITKDHLQIEDLIASESIVFYEVIRIQLKVNSYY